ncbi:tetratricopeptide repeat protein [Halieaceae bacterium IMCC8485]|uniref:Tetratricopeptide repeat protein n=1 Tax=Candidatus Seongchinamella marina TaxID=2518990 RepID=A0ABT3SZK7_9GAMM|nr:tetratricopeptide repeat protein [Candidatus Seongchinamella marina]MCX2975031.1 tetratricopeptide repeat protein [Candidatus Seongchinamella marina]
MYRLLVTALGYALLTACTSTSPEPATVDVVAAVEPAVAEPPERAFPAESVYPLLVAEFAIRRQDYQTALDNYLEQSSILEDSGIASHTTHLAQFMQKDAQSLRAAQLWLEQEPDNLEAHNTAAKLLARSRRPVQALPHMSFVARSGKQANFPLLLQGFDQIAATDQSQLVQGLNELALEFPEDPALLLTLALVNTEFKQYEQALGRLDSLFKVEPYQHQALLLEARILAQIEAKKPFARIKRTLKTNPEDSRLRLEFARLLTNIDIDAAREQFEVLSLQSPDDADLLLSLALINREIGDNVVAVTYLEQILATGKRTDEAHYYLGRIAEEEKQLQQALANYMQIGDSRQYLAANQRIGQILVSEGQLEDSHSWFVQQRQRVPSRSEQLFGIEAEVLSSEGALQASLEVLNAGIDAYPDSASLRYARSMLGQQQSDIAMMEADLRAILARDPNNATALNALGYTLADQTDRLDEAHSLISRALELDPAEPAILDSMGWVLFRKGEIDQSIDYLTRAYAAFPDPEVAAHLGEVLWMNGDTEKARQIWQGALLKAPNHSVLQETLLRLGVTDLNTLSTPPQTGS